MEVSKVYSITVKRGTNLLNNYNSEILHEYSQRALAAVKLARARSVFLSKSVLWAFVNKAVKMSSKKGERLFCYWSSWTGARDLAKFSRALQIWFETRGLS